LRVVAITNRQLLTYLILFLAPLLVVLVLWSALVPITVELQVAQSGRELWQICQSANDKIFSGIAFSYVPFRQITFPFIKLTNSTGWSALRGRSNLVLQNKKFTRYIQRKLVYCISDIQFTRHFSNLHHFRYV